MKMNVSIGPRHCVCVNVKAELRKMNIHYSQQMTNFRDIKTLDKNEIRQASQKS